MRVLPLFALRQIDVSKAVAFDEITGDGAWP
jgi:hypothetical protein